MQKRTFKAKKAQFHLNIYLTLQLHMPIFHLIVTYKVGNRSFIISTKQIAFLPSFLLILFHRPRIGSFSTCFFSPQLLTLYYIPAAPVYNSIQSPF